MLVLITLVSLITCLVIIYIFRKQKKINLFKFYTKNHYIHKGYIPRLGSIPILISLVWGLIYFSNYQNEILTKILISLIPIFFVGIYEDFFGNVRPISRMLSSILSGVIAVIILEIWLKEIRVPYFDKIFEFIPFAICLTIFASTTLSHSYNLVDGLNGLSSGIFLINCLSFMYLCKLNNDVMLFNTSLILFLAVLGFWIINILTGRIFLGDAGAYSLGHITAFLAIIIVSKHQYLSPWIIFLNVSWPIVDTIFSILRRIMNQKKISSPDNKHLHHLIYSFMLSKISIGNKNFINSISSTIILLIIGFINLISCWNFNSTFFGICTSIIFFVIYIYAFIKLAKYEVN